MSNLQPTTRDKKHSYPKVVHVLSEIDLERKTAHCSVCGPTQIHIPQSRTSQPSRVYCICRYQELRKRIADFQIKEQQSLPAGKPRHSLSEIDAEKMTATCSVCGKTDIYRRTSKGTTHYICGKKVRDSWRSHGNGYYPRQGLELDTPEAQKERRETNAQLIYQYKADQGCKRCGQKKDPLRLSVYTRGPGIKALNVERLLRLTREQLMEVLEICVILCVDCHDPEPHHLENVDENQHTALRSTCGSTGIVIKRDHEHPHRTPTIYCIAKWREIRRAGMRRHRAKKRSQDPGWKPQHKLSEIDPEEMRAVCSMCGPTDILKAATFRNQTFYRCATILRERASDYYRLHAQLTTTP